MRDQLGVRSADCARQEWCAAWTALKDSTRKDTRKRRQAELADAKRTIDALKPTNRALTEEGPVLEAKQSHQ